MEIDVNNEAAVSAVTTLTDFFSPSASSDHSYVALTPSRKCLACHDKSNVIKSLVNRLNSLTIKANRVRQAERVRLIKGAYTTFTWRKITSDAKMNFYIYWYYYNKVV